MCTEIPNQHQFLWRIENFSTCVDNLSYSTPLIRATSLDFSRWNLVLKPKESGNFISLQLCRSRIDDGPTLLHLLFQFCLIDKTGIENFYLQSDEYMYKDLYVKFSKWINRDVLFRNKERFLPNDILSIQCRMYMANKEKITHPRSSISTEFFVERLTFLWKLNLNATMNKASIHVQSGVIQNGFELLCKLGITEDDEKVLHLAIQRKKPSYKWIRMVAAIKVLDSQGKSLNNVEVEQLFKLRSNDTWLLPSLPINPVGDRMDLTCDFSISDGSLLTRTSGTVVPLEETHLEYKTLEQDICTVYEETGDVVPFHLSNLNTDILLTSSGEKEEVWANQTILSARSPVFCELLLKLHRRRILWIYKTQGNVPLAQCDVSVSNWIMTIIMDKGCNRACLNMSMNTLEQVLTCMYTDCLNPTSIGQAVILFMAGVSLDFKMLRWKSVDYLISRISSSSLYQLLTFSFRMKITFLQMACIKFISTNQKFILQSKEWTEFRESNEQLAKEILDLMNANSITLDPV